jgi:hypothetical protein
MATTAAKKLTGQTLSTAQIKKFAPSVLYPFEFFALGGLDMYSPDEITSVNRCVYGQNFRIYNPESYLERAAISKRQGHSFYSVPVGQTADQQITSTTGAADQQAGTIAWIAQKITAGTTGPLTRIDVNLKNSASGKGPLIVAFYADNSGQPGNLLATSSIEGSSITSSYQYLPARFIEAPTVTSSNVYWVVCYVQSDGSNTYAWSSSTSGTTALTSANAGNVWTSTSFEMNVNTYVSTAGGVKGMTRYYRNNASPQTVFAQGTNVYTVNDSTGAVTSIESGLNSSATLFDWATVNNILYFVDGYDAPLEYNGSTVMSAGGSPPVSCQIAVYANHIFYLQPNTNYVVFSDAGEYETIDATNFLYVPSPDTDDPVISMVAYGGNLQFITRNSKFVLLGTDISSFTLKESTAKRGAVCASAVCTDQQFIYFLSDDFHVYAYNGGTDADLQSARVSPILRNMANTSDIKMEVHDKKVIIHYTPSGQSENQHRAIWDTVFLEWVADEDVYMGFGMEWNSQSDTGQWVQASSQVGAIYYGDVGYNDVGKPIELDWWAKYYSYGTPAAKHQVKRHYVFLQGQDGNYSVDCQVDNDNLNSPASNLVNLNVASNIYGTTGLVYGTVANGGSGLIYGDGVLYPIRLHIPGQAYKTQFRFVQNGVDQPVNILGWNDFVLFKRAR